MNLGGRHYGRPTGRQLPRGQGSSWLTVFPPTKHHIVGTARLRRAGRVFRWLHHELAQLAQLARHRRRNKARYGAFPQLAQIDPGNDRVPSFAL